MKINLLLPLILSSILFACKKQNHVDRYAINIDTLKTLPDNFYGYRMGRIYIDDHANLIWFNLDDDGNVEKIGEIVPTNGSSINRVYTEEDSIKLKQNAKDFVRISRKYEVGHIDIDKENKISFSAINGLSEQYVQALNDSVKMMYKSNNEFTLLENGWFEVKD